MKSYHYFMIFLKGIAMGAADVVPGVSGGTVAFITGIYDELLTSIKAINLHALKTLFSKGIGAFWQETNANFFLCLLGGIGLSFLTLAHVIIYCMETYPLLVWSFFFGLVAASSVHLYRSIPSRRWSNYVAIIIGAAVAYSVTSQTPLSLDPTPVNIFLGGAIAICAMILPGMSGSFILLLLGLYTPILNALKGFDVGIISFFLLGAVLGLLLFVRLLSWLLTQYRSGTLSVLTGFLLGSLSLLWPWKQVLEYRMSSSGLKPLIQENILPMQYTAITGMDSMLLGSLVMAIAGMVIIFSVEYFSKAQ